MDAHHPLIQSRSTIHSGTAPSASQGSLLNAHAASQGSLLYPHVRNHNSNQIQHTGNSPTGNGGYYVPPASELTSSNHDKALGVIDAAFEQTDRMLDDRDMKAFGDNSENIFQELNKIRKKQLALAAKHINIETIADDDKSLAPDGKLLDAADKDEIDPLQFARKGQELQDLMASLEDLGRSMSDFHELSNSTNKQPFSPSYLSAPSRK